MSPHRGDMGVKKGKRGMGFLSLFGIAGLSGRPARRAISSVVERAPDNLPSLCLDCEGSQPHG